jgi:AbiV family abortive infection protein
MTDSEQGHAKPYGGSLDCHQAAVMQAARLNAVELVDTADMLFNLKRFAHSIPFSTLAVEEAGKLTILQSIFLGSGDRAKLWKSYRMHRAKTENLNLGIMSRVRATFPDVSLEEAQAIAQRGPTPDDLEMAKQRAIYSDCLDVSGQLVCHLPRNIDWRQQAWERLCEAKAVVLALRDRSPEELAVWTRHAEAARTSGMSLADVLPTIHKELVEKGFVEERAWDTLLKDVDVMKRSDEERG